MIAEAFLKGYKGLGATEDKEAAHTVQCGSSMKCLGRNETLTVLKKWQDGVADMSLEAYRKKLQEQ